MADVMNDSTRPEPPRRRKRHKVPQSYKDLCDRLDPLRKEIEPLMDSITPVLERFGETPAIAEIRERMRLRSYELADADPTRFLTSPPTNTKEGRELDQAIDVRIGQRARHARERFGNTKSRTSVGMSRYETASQAGLCDRDDEPSEQRLKRIEDGTRTTRDSHTGEVTTRANGTKASEVIRLAGALRVPVAYLMGLQDLREAQREDELLRAYRLLSIEDKKAVLSNVKRMKTALDD